MSYISRQDNENAILSPKPSNSAESPSKEKLPIIELLSVQGTCQVDGDLTQHRFQVEFETRTLLLAAESERDKEAWMMSMLTTHAAALGVKKKEKVPVSIAFCPPDATSTWALDADGAPWLVQLFTTTMAPFVLTSCA